MNHSRSSELFEKSKAFMPGGVNSPVRAYKSVGGTPPFILKGKGSKITDVDGNEYIDYIGSWGPMILGHAHKEVIDEICKAAEDGTSFGAPTEREYDLSKLICEALPSIEMVRMVNSGTEAGMSAIRVARAYTGRDKILKFEGCYHGHSDGLLVKAGSGALTTGIPDSAGVPVDYSKHTIVASYNDCEGVIKAFEKYGNELAAVIVEPVAANMGVVLPDIEFLKLLRSLTQLNGALLIIDEVITGFRVAYSGAQSVYGITPDLTVLGKIIGGGMPIGAYGGRKELMEMVSPMGPMYQAGTLSGNPIAMAAGIKTLEILKNTPGFYDQLEDKSRKLEDQVIKTSKKYSIPVSINRIGSLMSIFFNEDTVINYETAMKSDIRKFTDYFKNMLAAGIYLAPSQFEAMFISYTHSDDDILKTGEAVDFAFSKLTGI